MRRRPKVQLDVTTGKPLVMPPEFAEFITSEWPGTTEYHRWQNWWEARNAWGREHNASDEVMDISNAGETAPRLTAEDIARII